VNGTKDNRLSRIYREGAWPEPSRQIDAAILSASRRAARERHSFFKRWAPSFAIAATVFLTSALVLKVYREQPEAVSPTVPETGPAPRAKQPPPASETNPAGTKPAPAPAAQPASTPRGFSSTMDAAEAERLGRLQRELDLKRGVSPSESPLPAPRPAPAEKAVPALKKQASEPPQRRPDVLQTQRAQEQPANAPMSVFGATAPAPQPPRAAAKPVPQLPPPKEAAPPARPAPVQPQAVEAQRVEAPSTAAGAAAISGGLSTNALTADRAAAKTERTPQAWIEDIRKLMKEGMSEEAGGELAEFKKRYPDYVLPEDLR
jgi:hypothetical protein